MYGGETPGAIQDSGHAVHPMMVMMGGATRHDARR